MEKMDGKRQGIRVIVLVLVGVCGLISDGHTGQLVFPLATPQEVGLASNTVALPLNPVSALFHNPAQLTLLPESATMSLLAFRYHPRYANPSGYDNTSRELPLAPTLGYVTDRWAPFHVGIGVYGALGFAYNFDAEPEHGVENNFFTELAVISLAPAIAYSLTPNLHLGFALNPSYGRLRFKTPSPVGRIDLDVRGPGLFSTVGLLYSPTSKLTLGIGYKTPGMILMRGNARIAGRGDDAKVDFYLPQGVEVGAAYRLTERLTVVVQGRWIQFSAFEDTNLEFERHRALNGGAVDDARDGFRFGGGIQYVLLRGVTLSTGISWEPWAVKASSLMPTLPDLTEYTLFPVGVTIDRGSWSVSLAAGYSYIETRRVTADRNPRFPGTYALDQASFGVQITRRFGEDERVTSTDDTLALRRSVSDEKQVRKKSSHTDPQNTEEQGRVQEESDRDQWVRLCDVQSYEAGRCTP